uniref:Uncharacterized protein n=1 Tax=Arundo donax TaxID=35708 RepID=A0A0A9BPX9_ARUDO
MSLHFNILGDYSFAKFNNYLPC